MRAIVIPLLLLGCETGPPAQRAPAPSKPVVAPQPKVEPPGPHAIEWQVGGLGSWKGEVGGIAWHVTIDLAKATISITDPGGGTTQHTLASDAMAEYMRLAKAVTSAPPYKPSNGCTDRSETLKIDRVVLTDTCPIAQADAAALIAKFSGELDAASR